MDNENQIRRDDNTWRWTGSPARFLFFDSRASVAFPVFFLHMSFLTFGLVVGTILVFWLLEQRKITVPVAMRALRFRLIGMIGYPIHIRSGNYLDSRRIEYGEVR